MGFFDALNKGFLAPAAYEEGFEDGRAGRPRSKFYMRTHRTQEQKDSYDKGYADGQQARMTDAFDKR